MKFKSILTKHFEDYTAYRKGLGYIDKNLVGILKTFDCYIIEKNASWSDFTPLFFLNFRNELKNEAKTVNRILSVVRGFFQFMVRRGKFDENPLQDIPSKTENAFIPFIFSPEEVDLILHIIQNNIRKTEQYFFRDLSVYLAMLLLARCGLRISEPLRLHTDSYRKKQKTIYIEKTKFSKERLLPLPRELAWEINNYLALRSHFVEDSKNRYLLAGKDKRGLSTNYIYPIFKKAIKTAGLAQPKHIIINTTFGSPTPHCFRHSFAINTLKNIKKRGQCPQKALPFLSAYLGHQKYRYTAVYLKMLDAEQHKSLVNFAIGHQEEI
jgi:integrase/recombinase XerD